MCLKAPPKSRFDAHVWLADHVVGCRTPSRQGGAEAFSGVRVLRPATLFPEPHASRARRRCWAPWYFLQRWFASTLQSSCGSTACETIRSHAAPLSCPSQSKTVRRLCERTALWMHGRAVRQHSRDTLTHLAAVVFKRESNHRNAVRPIWTSSVLIRMPSRGTMVYRGAVRWRWAGRTMEVCMCLTGTGRPVPILSSGLAAYRGLGRFHTVSSYRRDIYRLSLRTGMLQWRSIGACLRNVTVYRRIPRSGIPEYMERYGHAPCTAYRWRV